MIEGNIHDETKDRSRASRLLSAVFATFPKSVQAEVTCRVLEATDLRDGPDPIQDSKNTVHAGMLRTIGIG